MREKSGRIFRNKDRAYLRRILKEPAFALAVCVAVVGAGLGIIQASHTPALPNVLDGISVISLDGIALNDKSGYSVSGGGDVNGDGIDDILVAAPYAYGDAGKTYVIFGSTAPTSISLSAIAGGTGGFVINGADFADRSGFSVSIGGNIEHDVNNRDDIIIGAPKANVGGAGSVYVVFGKDNGTAVSLDDIETETGGHGFVINGVVAGDNAGHSVSGAGNINGDSFDDLVIGAPYADVPSYSGAGRSYVVFGKSTTTPIDLSDLESGTPTGGFVINGFEASLFSGWSVSGAGNFNGDSFDDLVIGAPNANGNYGEAYVVFGKSTASAIDLDVDVLQGAEGFAMNRNVGPDLLGWSVSGAGDVDGDGMDDIIVGAPDADRDGDTNVGYSFVVFGRTATTTIDLDQLETNKGFSIEGVGDSDQSGFSVSGAGDVDGDGLADLIVGSVEGNSYEVPKRGKAHVVFGKSTFAPVLLEDVEEGVGGFVVRGVDANDELGTSVSGAGDFDGDGLDDVIIGAPQVSISAIANVGQSYVLFNPGVSTPLVIELRDADTLEAIPSGIVIAEWDDIPCGFAVEMAAIDGQGRSIYMSGQTKIGDYRLRATAPGYWPADIVIVTPDTSGDPVATIELTKDTGLTQTNVIRVEINMLDGAGGTPTGELLLSDSLALRQNSIELEISAIFGVGEIIFHGVPSGTFEVYHYDTDEHEFTTIDITVGTGEDKSTSITASLVAPLGLTRGSLPGRIVGSVSNTGPSSPVVLPDAVVYSTQTNLEISTITLSKANGTYFFPSIVEGTGTLQAFSSDGLTEGGKKPTVIISNQLFGDNESEESDLSITINAGQNDNNPDSDFDGLTDDFEANFLSGAPINERGALDDPDDDGLSNLEEQNANTHPMLADTDSDNYHDGIELNWGSDPTNQASTPTAPNSVWVDFGYNGKMNAGTLGKPFVTLQDAIDHAPSDATIRIKGDVSTTLGANPEQPITIPITIESFRGTITIQ